MQEFAPLKNKYRNDKRDAEFEKLMDNDLDVREIRKQEFMQYLSVSERRKVEISQNYEGLMKIKQNAIKDQFKPLDLFYNEQRSKFSSDDIDLIDKAERYFEEALNGWKAAKDKKYETALNVKKLIAFVEWASKRGGDAWNPTIEKP